MAEHNQNRALDVLQLEKARLEIEVLKKSLRPDYRNAAVLIGVLTAMLAILGLTVQWRNAAKDSEIAQLRTQEAIREAKTASDQLAAAKLQQSELDSKLQAIQQRLTRESASLAHTQQQAQNARNALSNAQQLLAGKAAEIRRLEQSAQQTLIAQKAELYRLVSRQHGQQDKLAELMAKERQLFDQITVDEIALEHWAKWSRMYLDTDIITEIQTATRHSIREVYDENKKQLAELPPLREPDMTILSRRFHHNIRALELQFPWLTQQERGH